MYDYILKLIIKKKGMTCSKSFFENRQFAYKDFFYLSHCYMFNDFYLKSVK